MKNKFLISEDFYSIQCEGLYSSGVPAYFIRLSSCNLSCGATPKFVNEFKKDMVNYDPGTFQGDLHKDNRATWTCDTIPVWAKGIERDFQYLIDRWNELNILEDIENKLIHLVWSGGEPTIAMHQRAIEQFNEWCNKSTSFYQEIETNGTFLFNSDLKLWMDQINCSPKLSNSGMSYKQRIVPEVIEQIMTHNRYQFKFVVSNEEDIDEMFRDYINPFKIPLTKVVCMPGLDSQDNFHERTRFILEMAKKYKFRGLTRLHVSAWDKTTGV